MDTPIRLCLKNWDNPVIASCETISQHQGVDQRRQPARHKEANLDLAQVAHAALPANKCGSNNLTVSSRGSTVSPLRNFQRVVNGTPEHDAICCI